MAGLVQHLVLGATCPGRHQVTERKSRLNLTRFGSHENVSQHKKSPSSTISAETALQWSESFEELMKNSDGVETFSRFLRTEFSEENLDFWLACEEYHTLHSDKKLLSKAKHIYALFIESDAPKEVNIDYKTKVAIQEELAEPTRTCFQAAQLKVYSLMKKDSYPRFLQSDMYLGLARKKGPGAGMFRRRSRSCVFSERGAAAAQPSPW
nr:regulator of G-protein signaling 21-like isoform X1 [Nerophis lumbriciformis]